MQKLADIQEMTEETKAPEPKQNTLFKIMLLASGWTPEDGPAPGIFESKPRGHKCLWSVKWGTRFGLVLPGDLLRIEDASDIQLMFEAADVAARDSSANAARIGLTLTSNEGPDLWKTIRLLRNFLAEERLTYPEFVSDTIPPPRERLGRLKVRPGWGDAETIFAKAMVTI